MNPFTRGINHGSCSHNNEGGEGIVFKEESDQALESKDKERRKCYMQYKTEQLERLNI